MSVGPYISGAGHAGLIGWMLLGLGVGPTPEQFEFTQVSMVSSADFAELVRGNQPDDPSDDPAEPEAPLIEQTPPAPEQETPPEVQQPPQTAPPPDSEQAPETPAPLTPPPQTPSAPDAPQVPSPETEASDIPGASQRPRPRPAPRVAPIAVAPQEPDRAVDEVAQEAPSPDAQSEQTTEATESTAPIEANTQTVIADDTPAGAPLTSQRPQTRPSRPTATAQTTPDTPETPPDTPASEPAPVEDPADQQADSIAAAVAAAQNEASPSQGNALTDAQTTNLLRQIGGCWNAGSVSSEVLGTVIVVTFSMLENGKPDTGTFRMISFSGGNQASADIAYRMTRSAVTRCAGSAGYDLPSDNYDIWREIELTVDPRRMRTR